MEALNPVDRSKIFADNAKKCIFASDRFKVMTQIVLSIPNGEVPFLSSLAEKMGWNMQTRESLVEKFIASCPTDVDISDEEIQAEVNAVRYGR